MRKRKHICGPGVFMCFYKSPASFPLLALYLQIVDCRWFSHILSVNTLIKVSCIILILYIYIHLQSMTNTQFHTCTHTHAHTYVIFRCAYISVHKHIMYVRIYIYIYLSIYLSLSLSVSVCVCKLRLGHGCKPYHPSVYESGHWRGTLINAWFSGSCFSVVLQEIAGI